MRLLLAVLATALVAAVLVPVCSVRAEDAADPAVRLSALELETKSLRADVEYLLAREASTSRYLQSMSTAVQSLEAGIVRTRQEGFEAAAISGPSRVALLRTLERLAADLSAGVPFPSRAELVLRARAEDARKQLPR
jgi:hypothetical protein